MTKASTYRDQSVGELEASYDDLQKAIFQLKNEMKLSKKAEKPHLLREKRKDVARLLTVMHEKQTAKPKRKARGSANG